MIQVEKKVGRLIEVRAISPITQEEVDRFQTAMMALLRDARPAWLVCVDVTQLRVLPAALSQRLVEFLRADNPRIERSGFLLPHDNAVVRLQFDRLIREAANERRRAFVDEVEVELWLAEKLSHTERVRLGMFLNKGPSAA